ncbi:hypothetical protein [Novipirellula galeiformis]|uniref:hypothetical protein n=1 Tax=Novipirellula galeiformis TaxID=2528004 RepID=UPI001E6152FF|nr:hypothetical protein [Novipirellula galeiformis]
MTKLFGNVRNLGCKKGCDSGCDSICDSGCGCGASVPHAPYEAAPVAAPEVEAAPMPPAPIVDPSASVTSKRRVIQASASYVR